jgi:hypothetical protein
MHAYGSPGNFIGVRRFESRATRVADRFARCLAVPSTQHPGPAFTDVNQSDGPTDSATCKVEVAGMPITLADFIEMAEICAFNARRSMDPRTSEELWKMALKYRRLAAELDGGKEPDIGAPPRMLAKKTSPIIRASWDPPPRP